MLRFASLHELGLHNVWLAIGSFDGVHRGHQVLIESLVENAHAQGATAAVLTFHPHPAVVLRGRSGPYYLTSPEERSELLHGLGVDEVVFHPFSREVASLTAREFMQRMRRHLDLRKLYAGPDFALGHNREGNLEMLRRLGDELGYTVETFSPLELDGQVVSSSRIRQALREGDVILAEQLLGRRYALQGPVVPGDGRGRTIGIPTANLEIPDDRLAPKTGVYACQAVVDGTAHLAVTNIGVRPTFTDSQAVLPRVETHLLDYNRDLYGQTVQLEFVERLRDEQRFSGIQALVEQIQADILRARKILA